MTILPSHKKYLVTGGAGFIGVNFVKYIIGKYGDDVEILVYDALTYAGNAESLSHELELSNVRFVKGDICDAEAVDAVLRDFDPDYVVNFAAESHVDRSVTGPGIFVRTNVLGTQNLLERVRQAWCKGNDESGRPVYATGKLFLQISTDEVYGSLSKDYDTPEPLECDESISTVIEGRISDPVTWGKDMFSESTPLSPRSPYSASKTSADHFVAAYHDTFGLPVCITRCSNNYGPYQFPEKLIPLIINNILRGKELPVYGTGENVRDWLYVDDHAKAIDTVLRKGRPGEVYNVGGLNEMRNIDIVRRIIDTMRRLAEAEPRYRSLMSLPPEKINYDLIRYVTDRPGHDMRYAINPQKIARELGWAPETPFDRGIELTVRWYLDNPEWMERVVSGAYADYYHTMYDNR